jgi:putative SOS response-associated peptidase YedK
MCYSAMVKREMETFQKIFGPFWVRDTEIFEYEEKRKENPKLFPKLRDRIFVGSYAPILFSKNSKLHLRYMRYGAYDSTKLSTYNARCDNLNSKYWKPLLKENRGIVLLSSFFEWVEDSREKKVSLEFFSPGNEVLLTPVIFQNGFAILTREPTEDILKFGHDRSPAFLNFEEAQIWLKAETQENEFWKQLLQVKKEFHWHARRDLEKSPEQNLLF